MPMRPHVFGTCQIVTVPSLRLTGSAEPKKLMRRAQLDKHAIPVAGWKKMYNTDTDIIGFYSALEAIRQHSCHVGVALNASPSLIGLFGSDVFGG